MLPFEHLLSRADASALQELLGEHIPRLVRALNPTHSTPTALKSILLALQPPHALLLEPVRRKVLLDLLRPPEAADLLDHLGVASGPDPFRVLASLSVRRGSKTAVLLLSFFGVTEPDPGEPPALPPPFADAAYPLFAHQRRVVRQAAALLSDVPRRALLHMPTGSGKTRTAMSLVADHLRAHEPAAVLWLAATEELCEQAAEEFSRAWASLGDRKIEVHRWWGAAQLPSEIPNDGLIVAGLSKIYSRCINEAPWMAALGDHLSLIVFDEAHQAIAPTYRHVVDALLARRHETRLLGLSATPGRTWNDIDADRELADFFSRKKIILEIPGYSNPMDYLIADGYLARPSFRRLSINGPDISDDDRGRLAETLDIPPYILKRLANDHLRNLQIAKEVEGLAREHKRILVFATTVEHSALLAAVLQTLGIEARSVTGETPGEVRSATIRWFREDADTPRVLVNFGVLTTGFDAPRTSAALIARPTKSLVLYSQMVGRAIRGPRAGGNQQATIVTVVDTGLPGFGSVSEAFTNWEDVWQQGE